MTCPYCHKPLEGSAVYGTDAYQRVKQGRCPHCGHALTGDYSVGFAGSIQTAEREVSQREVAESAKGAVQRMVILWLSSLTGGIFIYLISRPLLPTLGIILAILYVLVGCLFAWDYYYVHYRGLAKKHLFNAKYSSAEVRGWNAVKISGIVTGVIVLRYLLGLLVAAL